VVAAAHAYFGDVSEIIRRDPMDGTAYFDLWAANRIDLERAGVENIKIAGLCTAARTDEFFSHRAEQGRTGRFGAVMSL
jgi:copper oxidase (laccase) domain-containing protein